MSGAPFAHGVTNDKQPRETHRSGDPVRELPPQAIEAPIVAEYREAYTSVVRYLASVMLGTMPADDIADELAINLPFELTGEALEDLRGELNAQRRAQRAELPVRDIRRAA